MISTEIQCGHYGSPLDANNTKVKQFIAVNAMGCDRAPIEIERYKPLDCIYKREGVEYIDFGTYPQDVDGRGKSPLQWRILNVGGSAIVDGKRQAISHYKQDGYLLLISENILDNVPYNKTDTAVQYKDSFIREWLNGYFVDKAFGSLSKEQKSAILSNYVVGGNGVFDLSDYAKNSYNYGSSCCVDIPAGDRVALLNTAEARLYFDTDKDREGKSTDFAVGESSYGVKKLKKAKLDQCSDRTSWYWLRNRGSGGACDASYIHYDGFVFHFGFLAFGCNYNGAGGVRSVIRLAL